MEINSAFAHPRPKWLLQNLVEDLIESWWHCAPVCLWASGSFTTALQPFVHSYHFPGIVRLSPDFWLNSVQFYYYSAELIQLWVSMTSCFLKFLELYCIIHIMQVYGSLSLSERRSKSDGPCRSYKTWLAYFGTCSFVPNEVNKCVWSRNARGCHHLHCSARPSHINQ